MNSTIKFFSLTGFYKLSNKQEQNASIQKESDPSTF